MKIEKIKNRINDLQNQEQERIKETESKKNTLIEELKKTTDRIEETFLNGDFESGEKLSIRKTDLEARINYLNAFIDKRKEAVLISNEEANEIVKFINDRSMDSFIENKKKIELLQNDIDNIIRSGVEILDESEEIGKMVNLLSKKKVYNSNKNSIIRSFYSLHKKNILNYKDNLKSYYDEKQNKMI